MQVINGQRLFEIIPCDEQISRQAVTLKGCLKGTHELRQGIFMTEIRFKCITAKIERDDTVDYTES